MTLASLSDVKTILDLTDDSQDAKLTLFISRVSARIQDYLGYSLARTVYTDERYAINNTQTLILRQAAIQEVAAVSIQGVAVQHGANDDNWQATAEQFRSGTIYRGIGWVGRYFTTGMTYDPVSGALDILVSFTAGWYLPGDPQYVEGQSDSLPSTISDACIQAVIERYRVNLVGGEGLVQVKEGGISTTVAQKSAASGVPEVLDGSGLTEEIKGMLNPWRRWVLA